ncbi:hypothetical protein OROMI_019613 [Orobanche minor]
MAMRAAATTTATTAVVQRGLRAFCSSFSGFPFNQAQPKVERPPSAEPSTDLFVSGLHLYLFPRLNKRTTSEGLRDAFAQFGEVRRIQELDAIGAPDKLQNKYPGAEPLTNPAKVVKDHVSGYSKGFGFIKYANIEEAAAGIKGMDGQFLDGWVIFAEYARPRPSPLPFRNNAFPQGHQ